jgi:site-specific recombinase XerC
VRTPTAPNATLPKRFGGRFNRTLQQLREEYVYRLVNERELSEHTIQAYHDGWKSFMSTALVKGWRMRRPDQLTAQRIADWQFVLRERGLKDWTRRTYLMAIRGFCRWLADNGHVQRNPCLQFVSPRLRRVAPLLPSFQRLEASVAAERSSRDKAIVAVALYGGLRAGEIRALKRANFDGAGLIGFLGKGKKQRSVPLPKQAIAALKAYFGEEPAPADGPMFTWKRKDGIGRPIGYQAIHYVVTRWSTKVLGTRLSPHKLRHAYGKKCVDVGIDIRVISEALGHESIETTKLYTQVSFGKTQLIANAISEGWLIEERGNSDENSAAREANR